jgi:hypothetical protein
MSFSFVIDSGSVPNFPVSYFIDIHFGTRYNESGSCHIRNDKCNNISKILQLKDEISAVIVTGDLTDRGYDGKSLLGWKYPVILL